MTSLAPSSLSLLNLKHYLSAHHSVSLAMLVQYFDSPADDVLFLIDRLKDKGHITTTTRTPRCGKTCHACKTATTIVVEWKTE